MRAIHNLSPNEQAYEIMAEFDRSAIFYKHGGQESREKLVPYINALLDEYLDSILPNLLVIEVDRMQPQPLVEGQLLDIPRQHGIEGSMNRLGESPL